MFGLLKKKIGDFIGGLVKKEEAKQVETKPVQPEEITQTQPEPTEIVESAPVEPLPEQIEAKLIVENKPVKQVEKPWAEEKPKSLSVKQSAPQPKAIPVEKSQIKTVAAKPQLPKKEQSVAAAQTEKPQPKETPYFEIKKEAQPKELRPKLGLFTQIKSVFTSRVSIKESEVAPLLEELHLSLLESDTSYDTAEFIIAELRKQLVGREIEKNRLSDAITGAVRHTLEEILSQNEPMNLQESIRDKNASGEPFVMMFLGPNGAGKTTTIAKLVHLLKKQGLTSVMSASDTFRAAAIEQSSHHADKLGVKVIKHQYGSDPAAVAFDAIAHAKANKLNVVLIDTAGRQETNYNLVKEMEKINRVIKPDMKVFIGEAIAGHAIIEQVKKFKEAVGIDAIILTKLDCDAKGGTSFSLAYETKTPILFMGTGQEYDDLKPFDAKWIIDNVIAG